MKQWFVSYAYRSNSAFGFSLGSQVIEEHPLVWAFSRRTAQDYPELVLLFWRELTDEDISHVGRAKQ